MGILSGDATLPFYSSIVSRWELLLKNIICSKGSQLFSLRVDPHFREALRSSS